MAGYIVYTEISHSSGLLSSTTASASVTGKLNFPNWSTPRVQYYQEPHFWQASTALF